MAYSRVWVFYTERTVSIYLKCGPLRPRRSVRSKALRFFSAVVNICTSADVSSISSLKALWCLWDAPGAASLLSAAGRHQGQVAHSGCLLPSTLWQGIKYVKSFGPTSLSGANAEAGMKKGGNNSLFFCNLVKQLLHQMQDKWSSHRRLRHTSLRWRDQDITGIFLHTQNVDVWLSCRERKTLRQHFKSGTFNARTRWNDYPHE